jgi:hypothetical protein
MKNRNFFAIANLRVADGMNVNVISLNEHLEF